MSKYTNVLSKISALKSDVDAKLQEEKRTGGVGSNTPSSPNNIEKAIQWYNSLFSSLTSSVNDYVSGNSGSSLWGLSGMGNKSTMEADLNDIITIGIQFLMFQPDFTIDLWNYFGGEGTFDDILGWTIDDVYIGINVAGGTGGTEGGEETHPVISPAIKKLQEAPAKEHQARQDLHGWMMNGYMPFSLEAMLEEKPIYGEDEEPPRIKDLATKIYISWNLKDIVEDFSLNIYIPTYIRNM